MYICVCMFHLRVFFRFRHMILMGIGVSCCGCVCKILARGSKSLKKQTNASFRFSRFSLFAFRMIDAFLQSRNKVVRWEGIGYSCEMGVHIYSKAGEVHLIHVLFYLPFFLLLMCYNKKEWCSLL